MKKCKYGEAKESEENVREKRQINENNIQVFELCIIIIRLLFLDLKQYRKFKKTLLLACYTTFVYSLFTEMIRLYLVLDLNTKIVV